MARLQPASVTIKALFAKSGNQCTFPGCSEVLVTEKPLYVGEVCHIEAASPGGPRYNNRMSDEDRRAFGNLMVLCHRHHVEIDNDPETYKPKSLKAMKRDHEASFADSGFTIEEGTLCKIQEEIDRYWVDVERINRLEHPVPDLSVPIDTEASAIHVIETINTELERLRSFTDVFSTADDGLEEELRRCANLLGWDFGKYEAVAYYERPFFNRNWEPHNLGVPNTFTMLAVLLTQLKIRVLEMALRESPSNKDIRRQLAESRADLEAEARSTTHVD